MATLSRPEAIKLVAADFVAGLHAVAGYGTQSVIERLPRDKHIREVDFDAAMRAIDIAIDRACDQVELRIELGLLRAEERVGLGLRSCLLETLGELLALGCR
jgi:hypothetical protein